jgi:hypothetical protein
MRHVYERRGEQHPGRQGKLRPGQGWRPTVRAVPRHRVRLASSTGGQRKFTQVSLFLFPYGQFDTDVVFFFTLTEPRVGARGAANDARTWSVIRRGRGASVWCAAAGPRRAICAPGSCARANVHGCQPRVPVGEINWDGPTLESQRARACAARLSVRARVPMKLPRCGRWYRRVAPRPMPPPRTSAMSSSGVAGGPNARRRGERGGPSRC